MEKTVSHLLLLRIFLLLGKRHCFLLLPDNNYLFCSLQRILLLSHHLYRQRISLSDHIRKNIRYIYLLRCHSNLCLFSSMSGIHRLDFPCHLRQRYHLCLLSLCNIQRYICQNISYSVH